MNSVQELESNIGRPLHLPPQGSWPESQHKIDEKSIHALIAAVTAGRPLLVRGEPGVGKSQLARAAAVLLERRFIATVIQPNSEYEELLWSVDHTQRLSDAQLAGAMRDESKLKELTAYVAPGPLWYALNWESAAAKDCHFNYQPPEEPKAPDAMQSGVVLLIDEIDKADISVANGLLEVLGNGQFEVRVSGEVVKSKEEEQRKSPAPLMVLTSNDTRQLPAALVRRCVVLDLELPKGEALVNYLVEVGQTHFSEVEEGLLRAAAQQIVADRDNCQQLPRTGQAEYIDLLHALSELSSSATEWAVWLKKLQPFFQKSHTQR